MKKIILASLTIAFLIICSAAQSQTRRPAPKKKPVTTAKPVAKPVDTVAKVEEPSLEETKAWIVKKLTTYKPAIYYKKEGENGTCEWTVEEASFDAEDKLTIKVSADPKLNCGKDIPASIIIDFGGLDPKKTNALESDKRMLIYAAPSMPNPVNFVYTTRSASGIKEKVFYTYLSFSQLTLYESNLVTRMSKAFNRMMVLKGAKLQAEKEAY